MTAISSLQIHIIYLLIRCKSSSLTLTFPLIKIYRDARDARDKSIEFI